MAACNGTEMHVARVLIIEVMSWYGGQGRLPGGIIMSCYVKVSGS